MRDIVVVEHIGLFIALGTSAVCHVATFGMQRISEHLVRVFKLLQGIGAHVKFEGACCGSE
jgi:hypothetical protein